MKRVSITDIEHDSWAPGIPQHTTAGKIELGAIHGVLPFNGRRNPITPSSISHKVSFTYRTAANSWRLRVGFAESGAEYAAGLQALIATTIHDVEFQPVEITYLCPMTSRTRQHTIDIRLTFRSGLRRLLFVRNRHSLTKPQTEAEIATIRSAAQESHGHELHVVDADAFSRPRRDNLRRMYWYIIEEPDPVTDEIVLDTAQHLHTLWLISDLQKAIALPRGRVMKSCLRLIGRRQLQADPDAVICEHSRIWRPEP
ncbi:hypothetical protein JJJ17_02110 [Paracoccus caeni]|uniref:TnsA endonuclease N-terminal domain-containing protein n=1 Tax=Paracoccus caeni TaxID=657651 RepID=A0A934VYY2_9RHOB|nr:hypothetical protein [Paracoccus caeni]MBK4214713.1 hypothetical protein [Paracoccus caeni]